MIVLSDKWLAVLSAGWLAVLSAGWLVALSDGWFIPELAKGELRREADMPFTTPLCVVLPAGTI